MIAGDKIELLEKILSPEAFKLYTTLMEKSGEAISQIEDGARLDEVCSVILSVATTCMYRILEDETLTAAFLANMAKELVKQNLNADGITH